MVFIKLKLENSKDRCKVLSEIFDSNIELQTTNLGKNKPTSDI
jgi:hypothetical protein